MQLFYAYSVQSDQAILDTEETRHCTKTLRKKVGDTIFLVDGKGGMYKGRIDDFDKKSCQLTILDTLVDNQKRDFNIHIAIAPTKNISRLEWFLEKTTEIGIDSITPILCQRSERKHIRLDRLQKVILSAAKQSLKSKFPVLHELTKFKAFLQKEHTGQKFIAHCNAEDLTPLQTAAVAQKDVLIMIGPEGDFSKEEVEWAEEQGFQSIGLGKSRLRTETAGIAACHTIHLIQ